MNFKSICLVILVTLLSGVAIGQNTWRIGEYSFDEDGGETAGGSKIFIAHTIKITKQDGKMSAHIYSQGFQTSRDLFADIKIDGNKLSFYFREKGPDQIMGDFEKGDVLLTFEQQPKKMVTIWDKFQPVIDKNRENGKVRFWFSRKNRCK